MNHCIFVVLVVTTASTVSARYALQDYYWRDYAGVIPEDAFPVGHDVNGQLIYIGQVLDGETLIPGKIHANDDNIYYEFEQQAWSTNDNVKILCISNSAHFKWVPTTVHDVHQLRDEGTLIKGGYQPNFLTFIGRINLSASDSTDVGKVICSASDCLGLYTNENGNKRKYLKFEILTYHQNVDAVKNVHTV